MSDRDEAVYHLLRKYRRRVEENAPKKAEDRWRERLYWRLTGRWSDRVVEQRLGHPPIDRHPGVGAAEVIFGLCVGGLVGVFGFLLIHAVVS